MIATFLLAETMRTYEIPLDVKTACLELLHARRSKIANYIAGRYGPEALKQEDIDDLDEITDIGIQLFHAERREAMAKHIEAESGMDLSWMKNPKN
ncbi:hypothetical protein [uncultured Kushneria sp.]|uniref:hypothetical protein n=1 Tax=uncultured Kushneria sp. TaxID=905033 RepID=UPI002619E080|nr:hypothetical protein [uncultured Kushneria sp.]